MHLAPIPQVEHALERLRTLQYENREQDLRVAAVNEIAVAARALRSSLQKSYAGNGSFSKAAALEAEEEAAERKLQAQSTRLSQSQVLSTSSFRG